MTKKKSYQKIDDLKVIGRRSQEQVEMLKRVFAGMELIDAKANMYLHAIHADQIGAIPHSLTNCVFAKTCTRLHGSTAVVFMKELAYIDMEDEDGVRRVLRFEMSEKMKRSVEKYDETDGREFEPGTYLLRAPSRSRSLDELRAHSKRRREDPKVRARMQASEKRRRAQIKSTARRIKNKEDARPPGVILPRRGLLGIARQGTGLVQTKIIENGR
jgi:hypothetical protein